MKLFAVALIATVVFAVSSAAPTIHEPLFNGLESEANVAKYVTTLRCSVKVATNASEVYGLAELWNQYKLSIEEHIDNIISNCSETENATKCSEIESDQAKEVFNNFLFKAFGEENGEDIVDEIVDAYEAQCKNVEPTDFELYEETPENFADFIAVAYKDSSENDLPKTFVAQYQCAIDAGRQVTHDYELPAVWSTHEPKLLAHLAEVKKCATLQGEAAVKACEDREHAVATEALKNFIRAVMAGSMTAVYELIDLLKSRCDIGNKKESRRIATYELNDETPLNGTVDYVGILSCAIKVGENVSAEFESETVTTWRIFAPRLEQHLENVTNCASAGDSDAVQACYERESEAARASYTTFVDFVRDVDESPEAADEIVRRYRSECLNKDSAEAPSSETTA